jgi:type VII secretion integral membrane protein EccD
VTGVRELRDVQVLSAAPNQIRVSVLGERTQLDVALPGDVPVAAFLPELARLVGSRDDRRDEDVAARDERRTFWALARVDGDEALAPDQTLGAAGVKNGELLRISARRALLPPTLYDDVVDAAARLNRASYAAWSAKAAGAMAFAGLWLCTAALVYFLMADAFSAHRGVVVGVAAFTLVTLIVSAAMVNRSLGLSDVATAVGWSAIALSAALAWVLAERYGEVGLAVACVALLGLAAGYHRLIGVGHFAYVAAAVVFGFGCLALVGGALGGRVDAVSAATATAAALCCLAVPALTKRLTHQPTPPAEPRGLDPFSAAAQPMSDSVLPRAEEVWASVRSRVLTRAGLLAGLSTIVVVAASVLLRTHTGWPALMFGVVCGAVLALRSRRAPTVFEQAALGVPGMALFLIVCVQAQAGADSVRLGGLGVLVGIAVVATLAGLVVAGGRLPTWVQTVAAYLDYVAVAALMPLALWPLGIYDRLGLS